MKKAVKLFLFVLLCLNFLGAQEFEDKLIIEGIYYNKSNPKEAASKWKELFGKTNNDAYLLEYFYASLKYKNIKEVIKEIKEILNKKKNKELYQLLISLYAKSGNTKGVLATIESMPKKDLSSIYELAYLYALDGNNTKALELYRQIYKKDKKWDSLKGILSSLVKLKRNFEFKNTLQKELQTNHNLPKDAYIVLLSYAQDNKDTKMAIFALEKLVKITKEPKYMKKLISLYLYTKNNDALIKLLEQSGFDNSLLYRLYLSKKELAKAYRLANKNSIETKDPKWFAQEAILTFELTQKYNALDKRALMRMKELFEKAFKGGVVDASYYNYYGYTLIDNNIDIKKGVVYVKKALKIAPKNIYYLDSLAWGYYKLKDCTNAKKTVQLINKYSKKSKLEKDIVEHINTINRCKEQ